MAVSAHPTHLNALRDLLGEVSEQGPGPHALGGCCYQHHPGGRSGSRSEQLDRLWAGAGHSARSIHWGRGAKEGKAP